MDNRIDIIKGIHPGKFIERDLKKKGITQRILGEKAGIPYQTINAIISGRRNLTTEHALKIENSLGYEEGFLAILQTHYNIKSYKEKGLSTIHTKKPHIRKILFWDTNYNKINWEKNKNAVIRRVLERGNKNEISEIKRYYNLSADEFRRFKPKKARPGSKQVIK